MNVETALISLEIRNRQLRSKLQGGSAPDIALAREHLRLSLIELYQLGYWHQQPQLLKDYMRLFRACKPFETNARQSMFVPDKTARYSP